MPRRSESEAALGLAALALEFAELWGRHWQWLVNLNGAFLSTQNSVMKEYVDMHKTSFGIFILCLFYNLFKYIYIFFI